MEPPKYRLRENTDETHWSVGIVNALLGVIRGIVGMFAALIRAIFS